ncbi:MULTISPECIES: sulfite exporter TauE/SafE family protein [unclassified Gilliamella]|uniref:sulfite exporter TauE/SafE family protein n=1 Tax=unclassified Gilliamella TaxID=2685620 RepID=UPI00132C4D42|nr:MULTISPECIES: sulfite exporter TauE/SafE family protein [unclassified Gilliamella]MWN32757.1 TSUP family transporter [Gilliamella sp. Pra-s60]MWP30209.1 TSUP family transporter [Gilliamella sp. Pra-s54]
MIFEFLIFLCIGAAAGLLAGMFGVGGGALIVPALIFTLSYFNLGEAWINHIAIATSLATIIGTSLSSSYIHNKNHNIQWPILKKMVLGCIIGTLCGSYMTPYIPGNWLKWIFILFLIYVSVKFILQIDKKQENQFSKDISFNNYIFVFAGTVIGIFSALVGVGGGVLVIPFLKRCGVDMRKAIGTSAAFTLPVAIGGTIGYIIAGWNNSQLPQYCLGFVYLPAALVIMLASIPMAKVGVQIAQKLSIKKLIRFFGLFLLLLAIKLTIS